MKILIKDVFCRPCFMWFSIIAVVWIMLYSCNGRDKPSNTLMIAHGQMPAMAKDASGKLHLVYGSGDSILYISSGDNGISFSNPSLINVVPGLVASQMRGPQIAASLPGLTVIASNKAGDIFSYRSIEHGKWEAGRKVNDVDTISKEGLMALNANGKNTFAVWLDLRDEHNKIFAAKSSDGGITWSANKMIYASPDTTVCECCKPSVLVRGDHVYVMFRNWLHGNRDLYLVESIDSGKSFGAAKKLGNGNWALDGCPMDGGAMAISNDNQLQTVWRRKEKIFSCEPGKQEFELGEGKSCTMDRVDGKNIFAWVKDGDIVCLLPGGHKKVLGKGQLPSLKCINEKQVICIWENDKAIYRSVIEIE